ncbi:MAG: autotransporter-associated beta strand repeat-containing protein, partial [Myxococcales bacterium]
MHAGDGLRVGGNLAAERTPELVHPPAVVRLNAAADFLLLLQLRAKRPPLREQRVALGLRVLERAPGCAQLRLQPRDLLRVLLAGAVDERGGAFGSGDATIAEDATLVFDQADAGSFAAAIGGAGSLVKRGAGVLELSGSSGLSGGTTVEAGRLNVTGTLADSAVT